MAGDARVTTLTTIGASFDEVVVPHLDAARRLARWLMRNDHDAEDVVQDASLRALRYFRTFAGGDGRAWFLRIVRNTCRGWRGHRFEALMDPFDEQQHPSPRSTSDPETQLLRSDDATLLARAMRNVPDRFRELLVLRELEGLSYRELADAMGIPIGTVMSSLSRAREALRGALINELTRSGIPTRTHPREQEADPGINRVDQTKGTETKRWKRPARAGHPGIFERVRRLGDGEASAIPAAQPPVCILKGNGTENGEKSRNGSNDKHELATIDLAFRSARHVCEPARCLVGCGPRTRLSLTGRTG
jgi:RNA polymerase sigma-70 factor (ECF subfamily)